MNSEVGGGTAVSTNGKDSIDRLLRLGLPHKAAEALIGKGITSARAIAAIPSERFREDFAEVLGSQPLTDSVHRAAAAVRDLAVRHYLALVSAAAPHYKGLLRASMMEQAQASVAAAPGYGELFGSATYQEIPPDRSVLSPAAYLVDLMDFVEQFLPGNYLGWHRGELWVVLLDALSTDTLLPQPALVAFLLEYRLQGSTPKIVNVDQVVGGSFWAPPPKVYDVLAKAVFPPGAPFDLDFVRSRALLDELGLSRVGLYAAFANNPDSTILARESLGLSVGLWSLFGKSASLAPNDAAAVFGKTDVTGLDDVPVFVRGAGLGPDELSSFLSTDPHAFVNAGAAGAVFAVQQPDPKKGGNAKLVVQKDNTISPPLPSQLAGLACFARLAKVLGWSFAELDWTLRSSCSNALNDASLPVLARVATWRSRWSLNAIQLCGLWSDLETNLYNQVFNPHGGTLRAPGGTWTRNAQDADATESWLRSSLRLSQAELLLAVQACGLNDPVPLTLTNLSKLYRIALVPRLLGVPFDDVVRMLDGQPLAKIDDFEQIVQLVDRLAAVGLAPSDLATLPLPDGGSPQRIDRYPSDGIKDICNDRDKPDLYANLATLTGAPAWLANAIVDVLTSDLVKLLGGTPDQVATFFDGFARYHDLAVLVQLDATDVKSGYPTGCRLLDLLEYRRLKRAWNDQNHVLLASLKGTTQAVEDVAKVAGWDAAETQAFLAGWGQPALDMACVSRLEEAFRISAMTGLSAAVLLDSATKIAAGISPAGLDGAVASKHQEDWPAVEQRLGQGLVIQRRDALAAAMLAKLGKDDPLDLYDVELIDTQTDATVQTSILASSIAAVQLYVERCRLRINSWPTYPLPPEFEQRWAWMNTFATWVANREVFLYPENYALPSVRRGASPEFNKFQAALRQTDLGDDSLESCFRSFADGVAEIASLEAVGIDVNSHAETVVGDPVTHQIVLIGANPTPPFRHYLRLATWKATSADGDIVWEPWQRIDLSIKNRNVVPVLAFGHVVLLWLQPVSTDNTDIQPQSGKDASPKLTDATVTRKKQTAISLFASSRDLNGRWSQPQAIGAPKTLDPTEPDALWLRARAAINGDESIVAWWGTQGQPIPVQTYAFGPDFAVDAAADPDAIALPLDPADALQFDPSTRALTFRHSMFEWPYTWFYKLDQASYQNNAFVGRNGDPPLKPTSTTSVILWDDGAFLVNGALDIAYPGPADGMKNAGMIVFKLRARDPDRSAIYLQGLTFGPAQTVRFEVNAGFPSVILTTNGKDQAWVGATNVLGDTEWHHIGFGYDSVKGLGHVFLDGKPVELKPDPTSDLGSQDAVIIMQNMELADLGFLPWDGKQGATLAELTSPVDAATVTVGPSSAPATFVRSTGSTWGALVMSGVTLLLKAGLDGVLRVWRVSSSLGDPLAKRLRIGGVKTLLRHSSQLLQETPALSTLVPDPQVSRCSPDTALDWNGAMGPYFWELFFHAPRLIASLLNAAGKYPEAKAMLERIFDPKKTPSLRVDALSGGKSLDQYLRDAQALSIYWDDPFDAHALARLRPISYEKAVYMEYVGNLLDWADSLFRAYTRESINEAELLYVTASHLLGRPPICTGPAPLPPATTYSQLGHDDVAENLEDIVPANGALPPGAGTNLPDRSLVSRYFGIPENDSFVAVFDRLDDRLQKLRAGLNIDGVSQPLPLFDPPIDPTTAARELAGGSTAPGQGSPNVTVPLYRFTVLLERSKAFVGEVCQLGDALLGAIEKRDAAALERLSVSQEMEILNLTMAMKKLQIETSQRTCRQLSLARDSAERRHRFYKKQLKGTGLSTLESSQIQGVTDAQSYTQSSHEAYLVGSVLRLLPQLGSPFAMTFGGEQLGPSVEAVGTVYSMYSDNSRMTADLDGLKGGFERRGQDWGLQRDLASDEVNQLTEQLAAAQLSYRLAVADHALLQRQIRQAKQRDAFLRSRFTSQELYDWTAARLGSFMAEAYTSAWGLAFQCQTALQLELNVSETYLTDVSWDEGHRGLLAGETLRAALRRMELAWLNRNVQALQIQKTWCLSALTASDGSNALAALKKTGSCTFAFQTDFDKDFPGHRRRQIQSVALTFPALLGPYQNVLAVLTQTSSTLKMPDGTPLQVAGTPKVVLSRGLNDAGIFEPEPDGRYGPFEGTGAISTWKLEILNDKTFRDGLTEVVFVMNYTALDANS